VQLFFKALHFTLLEWLLRQGTAIIRNPCFQRRFDKWSDFITSKVWLTFLLTFPWELWFEATSSERKVTQEVLLRNCMGLWVAQQSGNWVPRVVWVTGVCVTLVTTNYHCLTFSSTIKCGFLLH